jgi:hypothetical protein
MELPRRSLRVTIPELRIAHRCNFRTLSISFPRSTKVLAQAVQPSAMAVAAGASFSTAQQDTGLVVVLHLPPFVNYSIQHWKPQLLLMHKRCERNGVGLATPARRSSPQADLSTCTFAERDHTCTGNRTGKKTPGGAGTHTGRTQDTRAHKGTRVTPTNLTTIQPSKSTNSNTQPTTRTSARRRRLRRQRDGRLNSHGPGADRSPRSTQKRPPPANPTRPPLPLAEHLPVPARKRSANPYR